MQKDDTTRPEDPVEDAEILEAELLADVDAPGEDPGVALIRILEGAVSSGMDVGVIERLLAVHERYEAGLARKAYNAAVSALRADLPVVVKTETVDYKAKGGRVTYDHENLANMVEDLGPPMAKHGLSFRWKTDQETTPGMIGVTCIVTHEAGHSEEATLWGPPDNTGSKNAIQANISTVSYLERHTLKAVVGLAAGNDDDGAGGAPAQQRPIDQPRANGQGPDDQANGPGDVLEVDELHEVVAMFPTDRKETISSSQQGRLYNFAAKNMWRTEEVDARIARVLSMPTSEIPSLGDAY